MRHVLWGHVKGSKEIEFAGDNVNNPPLCQLKRLTCKIAEKFSVEFSPIIKVRDHNDFSNVCNVLFQFKNDIAEDLGEEIEIFLKENL